MHIILTNKVSLESQEDVDSIDINIIPITYYWAAETAIESIYHIWYIGRERVNSNKSTFCYQIKPSFQLEVKNFQLGQSFPSMLTRVQGSEAPLSEDLRGELRDALLEAEFAPRGTNTKSLLQ